MKKSIIMRFATALMVCAALFTSCEDTYNESESLPVESISLNYENLELAYGGLEYLVVTFNPTNSFNQNVAWSSSNEGIVSIDDDGAVTALKLGETTITATSRDGGHTASCVVTVVKSEDYIEVEGITIDATAKVMERMTTTIGYTFDPIDATNKELHWSVVSATPEDCIEIDESTGLISADAAGSARVKVVTDEGAFEGYCDVTITAFVASAVTNIVFPITEMEVTKGVEFTIDYDLTYNEYYTSPLIWSLEEIEVEGGFSIDPTTGVVTAVKDDAKAYVVLTADNSEANEADVYAKCLVEVVSDYKLNDDGSISIFSASGLESFRTMVLSDQTMSATLCTDIDLDDLGIIEWTPIGTAAAPYRGTFDGGGFTISNLNINSTLKGANGMTVYNGNGMTVSDFNETNDVNVGFFGTLSGATIKNLTVQGGGLSGDDDTKGYVYGGIFALKNAGSIAGYIKDGTKIINCVGEVDCQTYNGNVGCLVGYVTGGSEVIACVGNSTVYSTAKEFGDIEASVPYSGGLFGTAEDCTIIGCSVLGFVRTGSYMGGLVANAANTAAKAQFYGTYSRVVMTSSGDRGIGFYFDGATTDGVYWVTDVEGSSLTGLYKSGTAEVSEVTGAVLNSTTAVNAMNAAIMRSGNTEYAFEVGTDGYPVISAQ